MRGSGRAGGRGWSGVMGGLLLCRGLLRGGWVVREMDGLVDV